MKDWTPQFKITLSVLTLILAFLFSSWILTGLTMFFGLSGINQLLDGE